MIRLRGALEPVVAALYGPSLDERVWLTGLRAACLDAFEGFADVQAITYAIDIAQQRLTLGIVVCDPAVESMLREAYESVDPTSVSRALLGEPVVVARSGATPPGAWRDPALRAGAADVVRLTARPSQLSRVELSFAFLQPLARIPVPTRQALRRLAAHLESAARLRHAEAAAAELVSRPRAASAEAADAAARVRTVSRALRKLGMRRQTELIELRSVLSPDHPASLGETPHETFGAR